MTSRKSRDPNRPKKKAAQSQDKGYCLPLEDGRIKKGEVRNPWGPKGKPKPEKLDPFEFAASQPTTVTIGGKTVTVPAEAAAHLVNIQKAIGGDPRAHRNVQDERRSRRRASPLLTKDELAEEREAEEQKKALSGEIVAMLNSVTALKQAGLIEFGPGGTFGPSERLREALQFLSDTKGQARDQKPNGSSLPPPSQH